MFHNLAPNVGLVLCIYIFVGFSYKSGEILTPIEVWTNYLSISRITKVSESGAQRGASFTKIYPNVFF